MHARSKRFSLKCLALIFSLFLMACVLLPLPTFISSLLIQSCAAVMICASLRLLAGVGGLISFGHALYIGIGAYAAAYALHPTTPSVFMFPLASPLTLPLVPLYAGTLTLLIAIPAGWLSTRRSGTLYPAMVTLALCELMHVASQVLPHWFGDEGGLQFDRTQACFFGLNFAGAQSIAVLAIIYLFMSLCWLDYYTCTPAGRWLAATADDEIQVRSLGMNSQHIRLMAFCVSASVAGAAGALLAIDLESVDNSIFSVAHSGEYLMFSYLGGVSSWFGSMLGGVGLTLTNLYFPILTSAWQLYLGLMFIYVVICWPQGLYGICQSILFNRQVLSKSGPLSKIIDFRRLLVFLLMALGIICCVESLYRLCGVIAYSQQLDRAMCVFFLLVGFVLVLAASCIHYRLCKRHGSSLREPHA